MSYFDDTPLSSLNDILIYLYKTLSEGSYSVAIGGISEEGKIFHTIVKISKKE